MVHTSIVFTLHSKERKNIAFTTFHFLKLYYPRYMSMFGLIDGLEFYTVVILNQISYRVVSNFPLEVQFFSHLNSDTIFQSFLFGIMIPKPNSSFCLKVYFTKT